MIDLSTMTPAQLAALSAQAAAEANRRRKAGSEDLRQRLEAIAEAEGYAIRVEFVSHRKGRRQLGLPLTGAAMARELASVGLEAGAVDDRIDAEGAE